MSQKKKNFGPPLAPSIKAKLRGLNDQNASDLLVYEILSSFKHPNSLIHDLQF